MTPSKRTKLSVGIAIALAITAASATLVATAGAKADPFRGLYFPADTAVTKTADRLEVVAAKPCIEMVEILDASDWRMQYYSFPTGTTTIRLEGRLIHGEGRGDRVASFRAVGETACELTILPIAEVAVKASGPVTYDGEARVFVPQCAAGSGSAQISLAWEGDDGFLVIVAGSVSTAEGTQTIEDAEVSAGTPGFTLYDVFASTFGGVGGEPPAPAPESALARFGGGTASIEVTKSSPLTGTVKLEGMSGGSAPLNFEGPFACPASAAGSSDAGSGSPSSTAPVDGEG